jgi:hypothetical protein
MQHFKLEVFVFLRTESTLVNFAVSDRLTSKDAVNAHKFAYKLIISTFVIFEFRIFQLLSQKVIFVCEAVHLDTERCKLFIKLSEYSLLILSLMMAFSSSTLDLDQLPFKILNLSFMLFGCFMFYLFCLLE